MKVADFGLARVWGDHHLTPPDQAMGKRTYMAPEQEKNAAAVDHRADLYSVGVVLYEMLTGERPVGEYPPASQKATMHPAVDKVIRRALQPDPDLRFQEAEEMKRGIEKVRELQEEKEAREKQEAEEAAKPPPGLMERLLEPLHRCWRAARSRPYWTTAGVLVCLAVAGTLLARAVTPPPAEEELLWGADPSGGAPYVWEEHGKQIGFEAEVMEKLGDRLHLRPQFVPVPWDKLPLALYRGEIQVIFNGYEWSPQAARDMNATFPYCVAPLRLIVRKGEQAIRNWDDLHHPPPGRKWYVGALQESDSEKYLKKTFPDTVETEATSDGTTGALGLLQRGNQDASVQDSLTAGYYVGKVFPGLEIVGAPVPASPMVAYVARNNPALRDRLNEALKEMLDEGKLKQIYQEYGVWNDDDEKLKDLWQSWPPRDEPASEGLGWYAWLLLQSAGMTVLLACAAMPLAMLLGLLVALGRLYGPRWLGLPLTAYVEVLRGTPLLLQLFAIYYLLPEVGVFLPAFWAGVIGLAVYYSAYESEHYRAGLLAVPRGQWEAALTLGMSKWTALWRVVLPQALRTVVPSSTNDFIGLFKDTAVCSVIAVVELTGQYQRLLADQPRMIVTLAVLAALLYLLMSYPLALLSRRLERRPQPAVA